MDSVRELLNASFTAGPIRVVVWEVLYVIVLVLVLKTVLNRLLFQPILAVMGERQRRLEEAKGSQDDTLRAIDQKLRAHAERVADARRQALAKIESAKADSEARRKAQVDEARAQADARTTEARSKITSWVASAETDLRQRAATLARTIATQVLGREVA